MERKVDGEHITDQNEIIQKFLIGELYLERADGKKMKLK